MIDSKLKRAYIIFVLMAFVITIIKRFSFIFCDYIVNLIKLNIIE